MYTCAFVPSRLIFNTTDDCRFNVSHEIRYSPNNDTTKISSVSMPNPNFYTEIYFTNEDFALNGPKIKMTVPEYNLWDKILNKLFNKRIKLCEYTYSFDFIEAHLSETACDSVFVNRLPTYFTDTKIHITFNDGSTITAYSAFIDIDRVEFGKVIDTYRICIFCNSQIAVIKFADNNKITTVELSDNDKACDDLEGNKNV